MNTYRIFSSDGKHFANVLGDRIDYIVNTGTIIVYIKDQPVAVMASQGGYALAKED